MLQTAARSFGQNATTLNPFVWRHNASNETKTGLCRCWFYYGSSVLLIVVIFFKKIQKFKYVLHLNIKSLEGIETVG
jgi:hypothetical protein